MKSVFNFFQIQFFYVLIFPNSAFPKFKHFSMPMSPGVDMCGRTVMVLVGRNIPVTLIDIEKVQKKTPVISN